MDVIEITGDNFDEVVSQNDIVVMEFWAEWCGPCKSFSKTFDNVAEAHADVLFGKINTEQETELSSDLNVRSIPHVMILREGVVIFVDSGVMTAEALSEVVEQAKAVDMSDVHKKIAEVEEKDSN